MGDNRPHPQRAAAIRRKISKEDSTEEASFEEDSSAERMLKRTCTRCQSAVTVEEEKTGNAMCVKVIIKCQCNQRLSFLRTYSDRKSVTDGSCVMRRLTKRKEETRRGYATKSGGRLHPSIPEDMQDVFVGTMELCITDPFVEGEDNSVKIGTQLTSLKDKTGVRHFIGKVAHGSPAANMDLQFEDELVLCNDQLLVHRSADDVAVTFSEVCVDQEFTLLTRRITNKRTTLDLDSPEDAKYEYWQIKATITVDDNDCAILSDGTAISEAPNGYIISAEVDRNYKDGQKVVIKIDDGYLKNHDGELAVDPNLLSNDPSYEFEMLSYNIYIMNDQQPERARGRVFRQYVNNNDLPSFLYVSEDDSIEMRKVPHKIFANPDLKIFRKKKHSYSARNTLFFSSPAGSNQEDYYLEACAKRDYYLTNDGGLLKLLNVQEKGALDYKDHVTFEIYLQ